MERVDMLCIPKLYSLLTSTEDKMACRKSSWTLVQKPYADVNVM